MYVLSGYAQQGFESIAREFKRVQHRDQLGGSALAVYFKGEKVVDLWSGIAQKGQQWQENTMAMSYSTGKGVLSVLVHRLVDKGLLDYDKEIRHYWPAFGASNQAHPTLRHVLSHQSGLFDIRHVIQSAAVMLDWKQMLAAYEQAIPRFTPGTDVAYQALSYGWILGGLIEKVTNESLAETLNRELVEPLALDGAYFGVPEAMLARVAIPFRHIEAPTVRPISDPKLTPPSGMRPLTFAEKVLQLTGQDPYDADDALKPRKIGSFDFYHPRALQACMPAVNGVFTARSLARVYAMLAAKGVLEQKQYISTNTFNRLKTIQTRKRDRVMPIPMHWRLGFHRVLTAGKRVPHGFGHVGYNGSGAWCDPSRELSFAFVHSYAGGSITGDYRQWWLTQRVLQLADKQLTGRMGWF